MRARSWSLVPIGTAWSTGISFGGRLPSPAADGYPLWAPILVGASLYNATSYSKLPGVSSTVPDTRAPVGLENCMLFFIIVRVTLSWIAANFLTYKLPANPAALFSIIVGSGGLHMMMSSWSDIITTPGNCGNHTRMWTKSWKIDILYHLYHHCHSTKVAASIPVREELGGLSSSHKQCVRDETVAGFTSTLRLVLIFRDNWELDFMGLGDWKDRRNWNEMGRGRIVDRTSMRRTIATFFYVEILSAFSKSV